MVAEIPEGKFIKIDHFRYFTWDTAQFSYDPALVCLKPAHLACKVEIGFNKAQATRLRPLEAVYHEPRKTIICKINCQ